MKLLKGLLLGSAAALVSVAAAQAADLPERQAAPIEYVRICDAYGAGFFYIPGTDTCLKVGGLAMTEVRSYDRATASARSAARCAGFSSAAAANFFLRGIPPRTIRTTAARRTCGYIPTTGQYSNQRARDAYGWDSLGRIELDARTGTPLGRPALVHPRQLLCRNRHLQYRRSDLRQQL